MEKHRTTDSTPGVHLKREKQVLKESLASPCAEKPGSQQTRGRSGPGVRARMHGETGLACSGLHSPRRPGDAEPFPGRTRAPGADQARHGKTRAGRVPSREVPAVVPSAETEGSTVAPGLHGAGSYGDRAPSRNTESSAELHDNGNV